MNNHDVISFFKKIEIFPYENQGYIYFYAPDISIMRASIGNSLELSFKDMIALCRKHNIKATVVITKLRFWKGRQDALNRTLTENGVHMSLSLLKTLYACNAFLLKTYDSWNKYWKQEMVMKAALEAGKRKRGFF